MNQLREWLQALGKRFDAYSRRERALLATVLVGGLLLLGQTLLLEPALTRLRLLDRQVEQERTEAKALAAQVGAVKAQLQADPDAARKAEIAQQKTELAGLESGLQALAGDFVPPQQMNELLEQLLSRHSRLRLLSLKSLPPVNLAAAADGQAPLGLYKHGVELRLEGSYADLQAWLAQLETSKRKLLWGDVHLNVVEHPRSALTLTVYTLSTDKTWLAI